MDGSFHVRTTKSVELKPCGIHCPECRANPTVEKLREKTVISWDLLKTGSLVLDENNKVIDITEFTSYIPDWLKEFDGTVTHIIEEEYTEIADNNGEFIVNKTVNNG